ncbi:MAG: type I 3-dehydroquinate dehydratase [Clostridia bacterium]|nr:type I 3-dehydroquinate dehydratase [Clostridia bacterium]
MKKSFLNSQKTILTCMVQADNPDRIKYLVEKSIPEGAEAFGMQLCKMKPEYRKPEIYRELFNRPDGLPTYVTNYRHCKNAGKSDELLAKELLELAECGATLCDVMGDYFDACVGELTVNEDAVSKQKKLIGELHERGAEVLMSSHICKFTPAERVVEVALEHKRRGADICKIVTGADNMAQQLENLRIIHLLKEALDIPFLFLTGGESYISRRLGGALGNCMSLCVYEQDEFSTKAQPDLRDLKLLRDTLGL